MNDLPLKKQLLANLLLVCVATVSSSNGQQVASIPEIEPATVTDDEFHLAMDEETASEVEELIRKLGSNTPADRDHATKRFLNIGAQAFSKLRECYNSTDDFEVRLRIEQIVHEAYENHHVFRRMGYMGIRGGATPLTNSDDERIGKNNIGILVNLVNKNTGAERGGLKKGDIIAALNGERLRKLGVRDFYAFARKIQQYGPGSAVRMDILRDDTHIELQIVLTQPPKNMINEIANAGPKLAEARGRFAIWWSRFFVNNSDSTPSVATVE